MKAATVLTDSNIYTNTQKINKNRIIPKVRLSDTSYVDSVFYWDELNSTDDLIDIQFLELEEHIKKFKNLEYDYLEELPNQNAIKISLKVLAKFKSLKILPKVNPSMDGGIIFEFEKWDIYFIIEITNDKELLYVRSLNGKQIPKEITIDSINKELFI